MRHAPLSGDLRNIRRQDYQKKGGGSWTRSWQVHFTFKGRKPVSESFADNRHGGKDTALLLAKRFRDAMENEFAASAYSFGRFGVVELDENRGVSRSSDKRTGPNGPREHWYWSADWPGILAHTINRKFYDKKLGGSDAAKAAAQAARKKGVEEYLAYLSANPVSRTKSAVSTDLTRAPYTLFMSPENLDVRVWRYMDFTKFISMLERRGFFLPMVAKLDDPFEGSYARANEVLRPLVYRHIKNEFNMSAGEMV